MGNRPRKFCLYLVLVGTFPLLLFHLETGDILVGEERGGGHYGNEERMEEFRTS